MFGEGLPTWGVSLSSRSCPKCRIPLLVPVLSTVMGGQLILEPDYSLAEAHDCGQREGYRPMHIM